MGSGGEAIATAPSVRRGRVDRVLDAITLVNLAIGVAYAAVFVVLARSGLNRGADFTAFDTGWRIVLAGRGDRLYDPAVQAAFQRELLGGASFTAGLNPFNNPPHLVLPFAPLGLLPLEIGYLVWSALQLLLLGVLLRQCMRLAQWERWERLMIAGWLIAFPALAISFFQGAFSLLVAVAVTAGYAALRDGHDARAGALLVVASVKPQVAGGPFLATLAGRRSRAVAAAFVGGTLLCMIAVAMFGVGIWAEYAAFLQSYVSTFDRLSVDPSVMWNVRGTLTLLLGRNEASTINLIGFAVYVLGLIAITFLWRRGWRIGDLSDTALRFALTLVLTLLVSPHLNPHDDVLLVVAAVLTYSAVRDRPQAPLFALAASATPIVILLTNGLRADAPTSLPVRLPTLILVAMTVALAVFLRRRTAQA